MVGKFKVITLCGSTRFKDEFMEVQKQKSQIEYAMKTNKPVVYHETPPADC